MSDLQVFRAIWPIIDQDQPLSALVTEARADLPWLTAQARARLTTDPSFKLLDGSREPGCGGAELVLECLAWAEPIPRNVDSVTGEVDQWGAA